jgi:hypothetical protein
MIRSYTPLTALLFLIAVYALSGWLFARSIGAQEHFTLFLYSGAVATTTFMLLTLFIASVYPARHFVMDGHFGTSTT